MPAVEPYPYVYVNADGSARELHADERAYLEAEYRGADGNRPYIKQDYAQRDGWGELSGYMKRALLPPGIAVAAAPAEDPNRPMNREETIAWHRARGLEVIENDDGSYTIMPRPQRDRA